jgi:hypothetical protein
LILPADYVAQLAAAAAAAGAIMHGQFSCAQECLEAAGEWETAMALAVCAGDFQALRSMAAGVQVTEVGFLSTGMIVLRSCFVET